MNIICNKEEIIAETRATSPVAPDEEYITVCISIKPEEAREMIATLDSNGSSERATRDPFARAGLEAIRDSNILD